VRVVEAGEQAGGAELVHLGLGSGQLVQLGGLAQGQHPARAHGDAPRPRPGGVHRQHGPEEERVGVRGHAHAPVKDGARFSRNAATPSRASLLAPARDCAAASSASCDSRSLASEARSCFLTSA